MIYLVQCLKSTTIKSLRIELSQGQTFDCSKSKYDSNTELQKLVRSGILSLKVKGNAPARLGVHSNNRFQVVRESKVVKEVVEKPVEQPQLDMNALANVLLQQLGAMISPEAIAEAVAKQMPTQQVVVNNNAQTQQSVGNMNTTKDEALTFIPSNIISSTAKASSESLANETKSEGSEELSDALSALKALRKANKQ